MADIDKIVLNGTTYNISDSILKNDLRQARYVFSYRNGSTPINYNTATHILTIYAGFTIHDINAFNQEIVRVSEDIQLTYNSASQINVAYYDLASSSFVIGTSYSIFTQNSIVICLLNYNSIFDLPIAYSVDDKMYNVDENKFAKYQYHFKYYYRSKCPNFNTQTNKLTIYGGNTIYNIETKDSYDIEQDVILDFDTEYGSKANWLYYTPSSHTFTLVRHSAPIPNNGVIIGYITINGPSWVVDGVTVDGYAQNIPDVSDISKQRRAKYMFSYRTGSKLINYSVNTHTLSIYPGFTIFEMNDFNNEVYRVAEQIDIIYTGQSQVMLLIFDTEDNTFGILGQWTSVDDTKIPILVIGYNDIYDCPVPYTINENRYGIITGDSYVLPDSWSSKIESFKTEQKDHFTFAIQTDTHYYLGLSNEHALNLKALTHYIAFDFAANLGDLTRGYADEEIDSNENMRAAMTQIMERYTNNISCPFIQVIGNHETQKMYNAAYGTDLLYYDELWGRMYKPSFNTMLTTQYTPGQMYYYVDYPLVRVVVLNTNDDGNDGMDFGISARQLSWFTNNALNTDKAVMVMSHVPLVNGWSVESNYRSSYANIVNALLAFKNNGGTVIGCMCGHLHTHEYKRVDGILHLGFVNGGDRCEAVIVNLTEKTIDTITFGFNENRSFSFA